MWCEDDAEERAWLDARIVATRTAIEATETAIIAVSGGAQSYTLDTGQSRQTVTKATLGEVKNALSALYNLLAWLKTKRDGSSFYAKPGF
jgi:hypothetical protein